jgi:hypothetical protein
MSKPYSRHSREGWNPCSLIGTILDSRFRGNDALTTRDAFRSETAHG